MQKVRILKFLRFEKIDLKIRKIKCLMDFCEILGLWVSNEAFKSERREKNAIKVNYSYRVRKSKKVFFLDMFWDVYTLP